MGKIKVPVSTIVRLAATSFALGAGLAYYFDERSGARRRALVRDKLVRLRHELSVTSRRDLHDLGNRTRGLLMDLRHQLANEPVDDDVLVERVRAKLGHVVSHARAINVTAKGNGEVELYGPIGAHEHEGAITAVRLVPGVRAVDDDLYDYREEAKSLS